MNRAHIVRQLEERRAQKQHQLRETQAQIQAEIREIEETIGYITGATNNVTHGEHVDPNLFEIIGRHLIRTTPGEARTPGASKQELITELRERKGKVREVIASLDNRIEEIESSTRRISRRTTGQETPLQEVVRERDKLRIEQEFYSDILNTLRPTPDNQRPARHQRQRAQDWADERRRNREGR
jgi:peptidoglycan hydrolase CwlO-like protein